MTLSDTPLEQQRAHLLGVITWADKIRTTLEPLLDAHGDRVHCRGHGLHTPAMLVRLADQEALELLLVGAPALRDRLAVRAGYPAGIVNRSFVGERL